MTKYDRALTVSEVIEMEQHLKKYERLHPDATAEDIIDEAMRIEDIVRRTCFICGEPRIEGSEWCEDHDGPEAQDA